MSLPTSYTGTATIDILVDEVVGNRQVVTNTITPTQPPPLVTWTNSSGTNTTPPGTKFANTLAAEFPAGYIVALKVQYKLKGYQGGLAGTTITAIIKTSGYKGELVVDNIPPSFNRGANSHWEYSTPTTYWTSVGSAVPTTLSLEFQTNSAGNYTARHVYWSVFYTFTVVNGCGDPNNADKPLCLSFCVQNPNTSPCPENYSMICLGSNVEAISKEPCLSYYQAVASRQKTPIEVSAQIRRYCKRYEGFSDLFDPNPGSPNEEQRQKDVQLCACHLSAPENDPNGTLLYDSFYKSLVSKFSIFGDAEFQQQEKCLVPQCRSSPFPSSEIPVTGCSVPQCIQTAIIINNDGTISGDPTINQTIAGCGSSGGGGGDTPLFDQILGIVVIVLVVVVIAIIVLVFVVYGSTGQQRTVPIREYKPRGSM